MIEGWHRRHAIQIAAQLPEEPNDALIVLELTTNLVREFLDQPLRTRDGGENGGAILAFPASSNSC